MWILRLHSNRTFMLSSEGAENNSQGYIYYYLWPWDSHVLLLAQTEHFLNDKKGNIKCCNDSLYNMFPILPWAVESEKSRIVSSPYTVVKVCWAWVSRPQWVMVETVVGEMWRKIQPVKTPVKLEAFNLWKMFREQNHWPAPAYKNYKNNCKNNY